jgi:hypothetical protein
MSETLSPVDGTTCYPDSPGWWWVEADDQSLIPVCVDYRGHRKILSVCIPRCSTHHEKWFRPLKSIKGKWRGRVQLPLDNASAE